MIPTIEASSSAILWHFTLLQSALLYRMSDSTWRKDSNTRLRQLHAALVETYKPDLFLEAGACDAATSLEVSKLLPACDCVAFEANPETFAAHRERLTSTSVSYHELAASEVDGPRQLLVPSWNTCKNAFSLRSRNEKYALSDGPHSHRSLDVRGIRLDTFVKDVFPTKKRIALWIDCEGCAGDVLRGSSGFFERIESIFIEQEDVDYWTDQTLSHGIFEMLVTAGFVPIARDFEYEYQYNVLWVSARSYRSPTTQRLLCEWSRRP